MRLGYATVRLIEFTLVLLMAGSSMYSFLNNVLFDEVMLFLKRLLMSLNIPTPIYTDTFLRVLFFFIFSLVFLYLYAKGKETHFNRVYTISWLMHLPSILYFSRIDWLREMGLLINFQLFKTNLSFLDTLVIGMILVSGRILLYYMSKIRETYLELVERGASEEDLEHAISGMAMFTLAFVVSTSVVAFIVSQAIPLIASFFVQKVASLPYTYIMIGGISLVVIPAILIIYIYSSR